MYGVFFSYYTIIAKEIVLPVYETGLPAKSDHFFTSASLMTSLLLSTTMAEKTQQGCWCGSLLKPIYKKRLQVFFIVCVCDKAVHDYLYFHI